LFAEMNRRDAEAQRKDPISEAVIGFCIQIYRELGPGLLESAYEECLCYELSNAGLKFERQKPLPVAYKAVHLDCGYRIDLVVGDKLIVELKTVESLLPIHEAQLLTYLKLSGITAGLLINFNVPILIQGVKRLVNNYNQDSAPLRLCASAVQIFLQRIPFLYERTTKSG
jgi:GxxExxY protein